MRRILRILSIAIIAICCTSIDAEAQAGKVAQKGAKVVQKVIKKAKPKAKPKHNTNSAASKKNVRPITCPKCGGDGKVSNGYYYEKCTRCNGTGKTVIRY